MHINPILLILALVAVLTGCSRQNGEWHALSPGDRIVFEGKMGRHSQRDLNLSSDVPLSLFLATDASLELKQKYQNADRLPVRLEHKNGIDFVATVSGAGGGLYPSINGVISLVLRNESDECLTVCVIAEAHL